jgi:hypothetical protein
MHGLEEPFFQLCCCVSNWFWREIGFGFCRRPPRYVPYKGTYVPYNGTFGVPDQGQMLDV